MSTLFEGYRTSTSKRNDWFQVILRRLIEKFLKKNSNRLLNDNVPQIFIVSQDHISNRVLLNGIYERDHLDLAIAFLKHNGKIFGSMVDAGANIGNHSLYFSKHYANVYSFEPNPKLFKILCANSELVKNIKCFDVGLSDKQDEEILHIISKYNLGEASVDPQTELDAGLFYKINMNRLDQQHDVLSDKIGLIKIDVENYENNVLIGSYGILNRDSPIIFFEQHAYDFPESGEDSLSIKTLKKMGYVNFYEIDIFPRFKSIKCKTLRNIIEHIIRSIWGYKYNIVEVNNFDRRFYSFIIASKDELTANVT